MSIPRDSDILFRFGASTLARTGVVWRRGRMDGTEPDKYTFTRASTGVGVDRRGVGRVFAADQLRTEWVDLDGDGVRETLGFRLEGALTQLVTQPENFGAWTAVGTPVLTSGQADPFGGTAAYLIEDNDGAAAEYIQLGITYTGDATKAAALFLRANTAGITDFAIIGAADRHKVRVTWTAGVPSLSTYGGSGTLFTPVPWGGGWWVIPINAAGVIAGDTNIVRIFPAGETASNTGSTYFFGANAWNAPFPSSYQGPSGGATVRAADSLTFPIPWGPQDLTVYAKLARPAWADASGPGIGSQGIIEIGTSIPALWIHGYNTSRDWVAQIQTSGTDAATQTAIPTGSTQNICVQFANLTSGGTIRLDVGAGFGSPSGAASGFSAFGAQTIKIGGLLTDPLDGVLIDLVVARGLRSLADMAAIL